MQYHSIKAFLVFIALPSVLSTVYLPYLVILTLFPFKPHILFLEKDQSRNSRRLFVMKQFGLWLLDIPTLAAFLILMVTVYRARAVIQGLKQVSSFLFLRFVILFLYTTNYLYKAVWKVARRASPCERSRTRGQSCAACARSLVAPSGWRAIRWASPRYPLPHSACSHAVASPVVRTQAYLRGTYSYLLYKPLFLTFSPCLLNHSFPSLIGS